MVDPPLHIKDAITSMINSASTNIYIYICIYIYIYIYIIVIQCIYHIKYHISRARATGHVECYCAGYHFYGV